MKFQQNFFVVDQALRILWVGGDWDDCALRNDGENCVANAVLSTPLTQHITDMRTADAMAQMVRTVIEVKRPLRFDYRCDSPNEVRRYRMTIQPLKEDRALLVHDLRDAEMLPIPHTRWTYSEKARARKCSMCCAVNINGTWEEPVSLGVPHPREVLFALCSDCQTRINDAISATAAGRESREDVRAAFSPGIALNNRDD